MNISIGKLTDDWLSIPHSQKMTSQILQEGILDVKVPRGSEHRKLWKAWRRQWVSFSVVHPPGRMEPYLSLELAYNSTVTPENQIRISRDGLRLFRCRSKTRPYRTWAMMSCNKLLLFFAADSEIQAQEWMQVIRDGLWPPCFCFQMLTACAHEVSLIDDDNTFLSGLLGVYGRFVVTSEGVVSLMHPHWGSALLEMSLANIQDVHMIREIKDTPAGVISIVLKGPKDFRLRNLQFYCGTVMDTLQWIWSKVFMKEFHENRVFPEIKQQPKSNPNGVVSREIFSNLNYKCEYSNSTPITQLKDIDGTSTNVFIDTSPEYENLKFLELNSIQNDDLLLEDHPCDLLHSVNHPDDSKEISNDILTTQFLMRKSSAEVNVCDGRQSSGSETTKSDLSEDALYENCKPICDNTNSFYDFNTVYASMEVLNENATEKAGNSGKSNLTVTVNSPEYAVVNKRLIKDSPERIINANFSTNDFNNIFDTNQTDFLKAKQLNFDTENISLTSKSLPNFENEKINILATNSNYDTVSIPQNAPDDATYINMKSSKNKLNFSPSIHASETLKPATYGVVRAQSVKINPSEQTQSLQYLMEECSSNDSADERQKWKNIRRLPNIPSDFLDTSINSASRNNKTNSRSLSSEDDFETSPQCQTDEEFTNHVYEYLLDRKGTVYEEIDESEDEYVPQSPPQLPTRPSNLEIPSSLRLQKLSESITETLKVMKTTASSTAGYSRPKFIKKIRDMSRVMHVGPSEAVGESNFGKTNPTDSRSLPMLVPAVNQTTNMERKPILS